MSDITKCSELHCKRQKTCWRWIAPDNEFQQSYYPFAHDQNGRIKCDSYWKFEPDDRDLSKEIR